MQTIDRLPAYPLIANDPYFSIWIPSECTSSVHTIHWSGVEKPINGTLTVDGKILRFLGRGGRPRVDPDSIRVTPTKTEFSYSAEGVRLTVTFRTCALPDDLDVLSTPISIVDFELVSMDGQPHQAVVALSVSDTICCDGAARPELFTDGYHVDGMRVAYMGQTRQGILSRSADHITIDWGYLYLASACPVSCSRDSADFHWETSVDAAPARAFLLLGYDDIASINYFGTPCKAWYARNGKSFSTALGEFFRSHVQLVERCEALDARVLARAREVGGEDYAHIVSAAWRHTFAAHKLIATPAGEMALLSKENDSNGCIGTVDLTYPSSPLFLEFCPELVNAMCRPVLEFASMPVWEFGFAPHDVGRYPCATGQMYGMRERPARGAVIPPFYAYPAGTGLYRFDLQMPVEESGNLLILLEAAIRYGASDELLRKYTSLLDQWARYLAEYGEDPGEQLCTDDFAGHLAHNANLAAKAFVGLACYGRLLLRLGKPEEGGHYTALAREMAGRWAGRAAAEQGTCLTLDGQSWGMKYNLVWDRVLELGLLPEDFYSRETESYLPRMNPYGLPLDHRADYTKSDWICWCAAMAPDRETRQALLAPVAKYLRETDTRVPFSDWYDSKTGQYVRFIARSVQGGVFMPMLAAARA